MRATWVVVVLALLTLPGCPGDACELSGQSENARGTDFPPGAVLSFALRGCSTCDHSRISAVWDITGVDSNTTGNVEIQLSPHCPVRDMTSEVPANIGDGFADNNYRNCGDVIDLDGYVTNRTNVVLKSIDVTMRCAALEE